MPHCTLCQVVMLVVAHGRDHAGREKEKCLLQGQICPSRRWVALTHPLEGCEQVVRQVRREVRHRICQRHAPQELPQLLRSLSRQTSFRRILCDLVLQELHNMCSCVVAKLLRLFYLGTDNPQKQCTNVTTGKLRQYLPASLIQLRRRPIRIMPQVAEIARIHTASTLLGDVDTGSCTKIWVSRAARIPSDVVH